MNPSYRLREPTAEHYPEELNEPQLGKEKEIIEAGG